MTQPSDYSAQNMIRCNLRRMKQHHETLNPVFFSLQCFFLSLFSHNKPPQIISETSTRGTVAGVTVLHPFTLLPLNQKSVSNHYQNHNEKPSIPSTQDGAALVVPATCPGKQEHLTVWDLSSILFLLQHRCAAITSQVPAFTWTESTNELTTVRTDLTALSALYDVSRKSIVPTHNKYLEAYASERSLYVLFFFMYTVLLFFPVWWGLLYSLCQTNHMKIKNKNPKASASACSLSDFPGCVIQWQAHWFVFKMYSCWELFSSVH